MRPLWLWALLALGTARELDPAACARRFDVQRDKIIRTEESRDMGARYLSELDVGARAECRRLCCETDACDVFVYEEKGPGSCYLFACGPPEDFRCKFTAHGNFSSGVLALSRRLAELQDAERAPPPAATAPPSAGAAPPPAVSARPPAPSIAPPSAAPPPRPDPLLTHVGRCSRYQFECATGGECVAVYNACDGVPQCPDGSDEAPELGCPPPAPTAAPAAEPAPPAPPPVAPVAPARWPHRLTQAQPQHRYSESAPSSHIFSHKGGLLQEGADTAQYPAFEPPAPWPRRAWPRPPDDGLSWGPAQPPPPPPPYPRLEWSAWQVPPHSAPAAPPLPAPSTAPPAPAPPTTHAPSVAPPRHHDSKPHHDKVTVAAAARASEAGTEAGAGDDGLSTHPPAAVLLLVLGLLMTAALGGAGAVRAGAARRRRRGGRALAHDADYLVNGMYL